MLGQSFGVSAGEAAFREGTSTGALISVVGVMSMFPLILTEVYRFAPRDTIHSLVVDTDSSLSFRIHFDVEEKFHKENFRVQSEMHRKLGIGVEF